MLNWVKRILGSIEKYDDDRRDWLDHYYCLAQNYFDDLAIGDEFIGEDIRKYVCENGQPDPHHPNVWGVAAKYMIRRWTADSRVVMVGIRKSKSPRSHGSLYPLYQKVM